MDHRLTPFQWYHETQRSSGDSSPLEPAAASLRERFLLGLGTFTDEGLNAALSHRIDVFTASSACYSVLFPEQVIASREVTLSPYDRLSTALTVAQVTGVQSLCSHYAARLAPLDSPDATRESNVRLAQITQYARQLASQPTLIGSKAIQQLGEVGLSTQDTVTFSQIIGFISYQARVVAGIAALAGRPAVVLPGFPQIEDAAPAGFSCTERSWQARLPEIVVEQAQARQLDILDQSHPDARSESYYLLLAHDSPALHERNAVFNSITRHADGLSTGLKALVALVTSRINGSHYCAGTLAHNIADRELALALVAGIDNALEVADDPVTAAVIGVTADLTRTPEKFTAQNVQPLLNSGLDRSQALDVILTGALYAWENRLRYSLGDAVEVELAQ
ncbi:CMD domain-containing protein [Serratia fonticola]|uniref:CMD domain-containing protein n=1 Tax=Serratia fonticola TaxID=47917 RepID=UPI001C4780CE|nr:peroxidase-related enzyme [Serratia fonticola]QXN61546.1 peroxidase-related enzyme [Serratia fonticola]